MTLDVYAGLFGDDLDTVADLLDGAARPAAADSVRTREATGRVLPFASGEGPRRDLGFLRAREDNRTPDLRITSLVHGERAYHNGYKNPARLGPAMHAAQLNQLIARRAVFTTAAMHMRHPGDDYEGWRRDLAEVTRLVDEINRLVKLDPCPLGV
jgi:hypothetical protein